MGDALVSRGRQANPVLTYETALRRFFAYGGVSRRWMTVFSMGMRRADGGEVAYLRHAEVGVEENPGTLRCALRTGLRKSAVAPRRESANRGMTYTTALRRFFAYGGVLRRWRNSMMMADDVDAQCDDDGGRCGRQPPKDGCIIVAPGWLAYLGLVFERKK